MDKKTKQENLCLDKVPFKYSYTVHTKLNELLFPRQLMVSGLSGAYSEVVPSLVEEVSNTELENATVPPLPREAKPAKAHHFSRLFATCRAVQVSWLCRFLSSSVINAFSYLISRWYHPFFTKLPGIYMLFWHRKVGEHCALDLLSYLWLLF